MKISRSVIYRHDLVASVMGAGSLDTPDKSSGSTV
jgi:hypothetical protein